MRGKRETDMREQKDAARSHHHQQAQLPITSFTEFIIEKYLRGEGKTKLGETGSDLPARIDQIFKVLSLL